MNNQEKIWQVIHGIPAGKVMSYGQVAKMADLPGYGRFVGFVLKTLPEGTKLPWFRVVNSQGRLSFPLDSRQYQTQKSRLEAEGIVFINGRLSLKQYGWQHDQRKRDG